MSKRDEYEALRAIWYKKLEDSGFKDIEQDDENLKVWSNKFNNPRTRELCQDRAAYAYLADKFLNEFTFNNNLEKTIWEYNANGLTVRDIAATLTKAGIKITRHPVWTTIKRLEETMKIMYLQGYKEKNE